MIKKSKYKSKPIIPLLYKTNNEIVVPTKDNLTKLKFQLSTKTNYYSKTIDLVTKIMSTDFLNINLMINYDFANKFYLKPIGIF